MNFEAYYICGPLLVVSSPREIFIFLFKSNMADLYGENCSVSFLGIDQVTSMHSVTSFSEFRLCDHFLISTSCLEIKNLK